MFGVHSELRLAQSEPDVGSLATDTDLKYCDGSR